MSKILCRRCKQPQEATSRNFHYKDKARGTFNTICKTCWKEYHHEHYLNNAARYKRQSAERRRTLHKRNLTKLFEYFQIHPCVDCSIDNPVLLEFDHVRGKKKFCIGQKLNSLAWEMLLKEIAKCEVRCANCHRLRTATQLNWYAAVV